MAKPGTLTFLVFLLLAAALIPATRGKRIKVNFTVLLAIPATKKNVLKVVGKSPGLYKWKWASAPAMIKDGFKDNYEAWTTPKGAYVVKRGKKYRFTVVCLDYLTQECECGLKGRKRILRIPETYEGKEFNELVVWDVGVKPCPSCKATDVCSRDPEICYVPSVNLDSAVNVSCKATEVCSRDPEICYVPSVNLDSAVNVSMLEM